MSRATREAALTEDDVRRIGRKLAEIEKSLPAIQAITVLCLEPFNDARRAAARSARRK